MRHVHAARSVPVTQMEASRALTMLAGPSLVAVQAHAVLTKQQSLMRYQRVISGSIGTSAVSADIVRLTAAGPSCHGASII